MNTHCEFGKYFCEEMMIDDYFSGIDGIAGVIVVQWLMEFPRQEY